MLFQRRSRACQGPQSLAKNTMRDTCARRRVVVVVVVVGMLPQQVSVSPRHRTKSLITVTSVAISDQGIACVLGWVMALSAKALDDQYGRGFLF